MKKSGIERDWGALSIVVLLALAYSFYLAATYSGQSPLDVHSLCKHRHL